MNERFKLLEKIIRFDGPLPQIIASLRQLGWDSSSALIELKRKDIISILNQYLNHKHTTSEIEHWANAIEGRDDIGYESGYEKLIHLVIHELANPFLTHPLTLKNANDWIGKLS